MDNGYMQEIRARILAAEDGAVFVAPDFADIADTATIRQGLKRLYQSGIIRRIIRGIYEKPKYSKLLDEYVAADPDAVAKALARCYHWTIAPCGNTALNLLGLSTQSGPTSATVRIRPMSGIPPSWNLSIGPTKKSRVCLT